MRYRREVILKDGSRCVLKHAEVSEAESLIHYTLKVHGETEYLTCYPDENIQALDRERVFVAEQALRRNAIFLCAYLDGQIVGTAGFEPVSSYEKARHRASFDISVQKKCWGLGIGRALTEACIELAGMAGFHQMELEVIAENAAALALYESVGFREYGRNPRGFLTRSGKWQEIVFMLLKLC